MAYTSAYVFAPTIDAQSMLAGTLTIKPTHGEFTYANQWLDHSHTYPLDPCNLPLIDRRFEVNNRHKVFPVFSDAGPDAWGTKILLMNQRSHPANELERLLRLSGNGVGGLAFSLSRASVKPAAPLHDERYLNQLSKAAFDAVSDHPLSDEQLQLLAPGSSMGGARPKITIANREGDWLVKFSKPDDWINIPTVEYATMTLLKTLGLNVPDCRLYALAHGSAFMIKRFDRTHAGPLHFISAHSLFNTDRMKEYACGSQDPCSYMALATIIRQYSAKPQLDVLEVYRRMLVNVLIGNTDDHARNHAVLYDVYTNAWRLSPVYDVLPCLTASQNQQALSIGTLGRVSTLENALSAHATFGLSHQAACNELKMIHNGLTHWQTHFRSCGVSANDLRILSGLIDRRLEKVRL